MNRLTDEEVIKIIGKRLEDIRITRGISRVSAARRLGITDAMLTSYEKGTRRPGLLELIDMAKLYDISTAELIELDEMKTKISMIHSKKTKKEK